ncbi:MAG: signal peptidase I, partial [Planctomycetaceae bacterium]|nr:signal peptidase I [Planctomycetaceae bacterium]
LSLRWGKAEQITLRKVVIAVVLASIVGVIPAYTNFHMDAHGTTDPATASTVLVVALLAQGVLLSRMFKLRFWRTVQVWLTGLILNGGLSLLLALGIRTYLLDTFVIPTFDMAPTLVGNHWEGICPVCGSRAYRSTRDPHPWEGKSLMICDQFHISQAGEPGTLALPGDRFFVLKVLPHKRWDLIVFEVPSQPGVMYVKRLVGLPGETVTIEDGAIWIDGVRLEPPAHLSSLHYEATHPAYHRQPLWGSPERPAVLQEGEYFVLGDFTAQSADSRFWDTWDPDHSPYAVPAENIKAVATHIYWPFSRWRALR